MKHRKQALAKSLLALLMCVTMLVSTTFAWFTDSVTSGINTIAAGNLDVELYHSNAAVTNEKVTANTELFMDLQGNPILWEPGVVSYENLRVVNEGDLALIYQLAINTANENYIIDNGARLSQALKVGVVKGGITATDRNAVISSVAAADWTTLSAFLRSGSLLADGEEIWGVVIYWQPGDNDDYWNANNGRQLSSGDALSIDLGVNLTATQEMHENDSFGNDYDISAKDDVFPSFGGGIASAPVDVNANGLTTAEVEIAIGDIKATIPAGVKVADGVNKLTLSIKTLDTSSANVVLGENEAIRSLDVHVEGVAADNTAPITVTLPEVAPVALNMGNYKLYHVENGATNEMTLVASNDAFSAHNQFKYDPATGDIELYMASFSEVALTATEAQWKGGVDHSWYVDKTSPYTIANADQLWSFSQIVGGMAKDEQGNAIAQDSFSGKTITLIADIDLNDGEENNASDRIFYPIGYWNNEGTYERKPLEERKTAVESGLYSFCGTFDGNGHTIANFYHNTWEMKGDHNWYSAVTEQYYRDGMGLFGRVYGATIKNLTVDNFKSDGEIATTGVIAAYAEGSNFENIAITNCNPRVYNIGNGGIVGCVGWYAKEANLKTTFKNITVDNSNKISALWGSYDVACGGIVGQYYPTSGQSSANYPVNGGVHFENCHVSAQMDVYNDVCGNYQYYAYRYAGMLIGSVRENETIDGHVYPKMDGITAKNSTVHFGDWNDYYYCELVDNTTASYTHDYQMSRLEQVAEVNGTTITPLKGDSFTVPTSGRYNYVVVNEKNDDGSFAHGTENATCYHFKDGAVWTHDMGGIQTGIDENGDGQDDLKEDKQHIYLEFNNLVTGYGWGVTTKGVGDLAGVTILDRDDPISIDKFTTALPDNKVLYRVGNKNTVSIGYLFAAKEGAPIKSAGVWVTIDKVDKNSNVTGVFNANTTEWEKGTIQFSGTGVVKVTIQDYYFCKTYSMYLEVVDAYNVVTGSELKNRNSVLLCDIEMPTNGNVWLENVTIYGNGFEYDVTAGKDGNTESGYIGGNYAVALKNAVLNNIKIVGEVYTQYGATAKSMYNYPTILTNGNSIIANSYVSNGSAAIRAQDGNLQIINSTLEGGIFANLDIRGGNVTLDNVTTINQSDANGNSTSNDKKIVGLGIVFYECNTNSKLYVNKITHYNTFSDKTEFSAALANTLKDAMFGSSYKKLQFEDNNKTKWINPCILSITEGIGEDNVIFSEESIQYTHQQADVTGLEGYVWTVVPTASSVTAAKPYYKSEGQYAILPNSEMDHKNESNYVAPSSDSNEYCYFNKDTDKLEISFDAGETKVYDPNILTATKTGITLEYKVKIDGVDYTGKTITFDKAGTYTAVYTYTDPYNFKLDEQGNITRFDVEYEQTVTISVSAVAKAAQNAKFTFYGYSSISKTAATTITDVKTTTSSSGNVYIMPSSTGTYVTSKTIDGITVNCPRVYVDFKDNSSDFNWLYPIFLGVKIEDFANGGTAETATTIVSPTSTSKPANLTILTTDKPDGGGGWSSGSGKSGSEGTLSSGTYKNLYGWTSGALGSDQNESSIYCQFTYKDNKGTTYYYVIEFYRAQHDCPSCVTGDTLVTLADGTQKRMDQITYADQLLVWDFYNGCYTTTTASVIYNHGDGIHKVTNLKFSDGTVVKIINEHELFDADANSWVYISENNVDDYIGHKFVKMDGDSYTTVTLVDTYFTEEETGMYTILTAGHFNAIIEGMFSLTPDPTNKCDAFFRHYDVGADMKFDAEKMQADIEKYGLFEYEDLAAYVTYEEFVAFGGSYYKILVGKGLITVEDIVNALATYAPNH